MDTNTQNERVELLKATLRAQDAAGAFDMNFWREPSVYRGGEWHSMKGKGPCGAVCCIGGTIQVLNSETGLRWSMDDAANWLGAPVHAVEELFYPAIDADRWDHIDVELAIRAIDLVVVISRNPDAYGDPEDEVRAFWDENVSELED